MKTAKKAILLVLCAALLVTASVMGTLAYLQMQTETITNTMTVGKVEITLDEAKVDEYGVKDGDTRIDVTATAGGNEYKLIPGHEYIKDPTVTVKENSEPCYLFVKVVNEIVGIEAGTTISTQMTTNGWTALSGVENVYYKHIDSVTTTDTKHPVFAEFTVSADATNDSIAEYTGKTITITAYAIQADGFADANAAWNAGSFN